MTFGVTSKDNLLLTATTTDGNEDPNAGSPYCADIYNLAVSLGMEEANDMKSDVLLMELYQGTCTQKGQRNENETKGTDNC